MTVAFWVRSAAVMMFLGVAFGAFGAHALKNTLSDSMKIVYQTAVHYQFIHGLALLAVAWLASRSESRWIPFAGWSFLSGIVLFSGSLYCLSLTNVKGWGAVTPLGGLLFLSGWLGIFLAQV